MRHNDDLRAHRENFRRALRDVFVASAEEVQDSITDGSSLTGAPGQPVDTGELRGSWVPRFIENWVWQTTTGKPYAPFIEGGNYTLRSTVGGPHSVGLTRTAWPRIVDEMARRHGSAELRFRL